jgi:hypothetical protein
VLPQRAVPTGDLDLNRTNTTLGFRVVERMYEMDVAIA